MSKTKQKFERIDSKMHLNTKFSSYFNGWPKIEILWNQICTYTYVHEWLQWGQVNLSQVNFGGPSEYAALTLPGAALI